MRTGRRTRSWTGPGGGSPARGARRVSAAVAGAALVLLAAGGASGDDAKEQETPTEAGTSFRTAAALPLERRASAHASTGDYLYWVFAGDTGRSATVSAKVSLPAATARHGASTWQVDVYDGLRRRQACRYGAQTRTVAAEATTVRLSCTLRTVRAWAEPWSNDPLPGSYFVRLTALDSPAQDLGVPMDAEIEVTSGDKGGASAVGGKLSRPLVSASVPQAGEPQDGWSSGRWTDRWLWTAAGAVLAALAGIGGYALTRGRGRPGYIPPNA